MTATPTYQAVHARLATQRGSASRHRCAACPCAADSWAYDHTDPDELTGVDKGYSLTYSTDLARYLPLCHACHMLLDRRGVWAPVTEVLVDVAELADVALVRTGAVLSWPGR